MNLNIGGLTATGKPPESRIQLSSRSFIASEAWPVQSRRWCISGWKENVWAKWDRDGKSSHSSGYKRESSQMRIHMTRSSMCTHSIQVHGKKHKLLVGLPEARQNALHGIGQDLMQLGDTQTPCTYTHIRTCSRPPTQSCRHKKLA